MNTPFSLKSLNKTLYIFIVFFYIFNQTIYSNDYLNPFTLTFKNPKTLQMFNIVVLYHYVMAFLVGVIIFTFIFIFLSFFRTYYCFNFKTFYKPQKFVSFSEFLAYFWANITNFRLLQAYDNMVSYFRYSTMWTKYKHLDFYKQDIRSSLKDQITHAPLLEFLWVIFPALILVAIAYPSIILLYYNEAYVEPVFNITVIGNQWFWTYEYNDFNLLQLFKKHISSPENFFNKKHSALFLRLREIFAGDATNILNRQTEEILSSIPRRLTVDCNMIIAKDPKFLRLLTTDQCLVIPAKTPIRFLITSSDVIHSWAVPSYGVKLDAVPGRINQQILTVPLMGTSWGQCSELCGVNHAFMPIEIKVLAFSDFLYFMQLKIKEVLLPVLSSYYKMKLEFMRHCVVAAKREAAEFRYVWFVKNIPLTSYARTNILPYWLYRSHNTEDFLKEAAGSLYSKKNWLNLKKFFSAYYAFVYYIDFTKVPGQTLPVAAFHEQIIRAAITYKFPVSSPEFTLVLRSMRNYSTFEYIEKFWDRTTYKPFLEWQKFCNIPRFMMHITDSYEVTRMIEREVLRQQFVHLLSKKS